MVRKDIGDDTDTTGAGYVHEMAKHIGNTYTISGMSERGNIAFAEDDRWWWCRNWLDLVKPTVELDEELFTL